MGVISAISNDFGYEQIFSRQLEMLAQPGDVLVVITASGNSPNLVLALEWARAKSVSTIGLTGFDGGIVRQLADLSVHVISENGDYGVVEDAHLVACHMVAESLRATGIASSTPAV
jgi:D-sedoheptulose 7-phosphate isomerase